MSVNKNDNMKSLIKLGVSLPPSGKKTKDFGMKRSSSRVRFSPVQSGGVPAPLRGPVLTEPPTCYMTEPEPGEQPLCRTRSSPTCRFWSRLSNRRRSCCLAGHAPTMKPNLPLFG
ncbi:hypothetical protein FQA47_015492 [Oryzias melastigma]|uniref:Uncharacterized protein n=1 Tax=Oryzias melastigma TaxID=30732 RepID=A0A834FQC5_ORYME|nr:hypothetical protein FQA47_015492 [Oryzias melastigma]